jgi:hypothetical protein
MAKRTSRPTRQKKEDRLIHHKASQAQVSCDLALGRLDTAARKMNAKWGIDRLPEIVSAQTTEKWAKAMAELNDAADSNDPERTAKWVEISIRGLAAMDAEAEANNMPQSDPQIWEYEYDGKIYGIIADGRDWPAAYAKRPDMVIYNMREVAIALHAHASNHIVDAVKAAFNGAEIKRMTITKTGMSDSLEFMHDTHGDKTFETL